MGFYSNCTAAHLRELWKNVFFEQVFVLVSQWISEQELYKNVFLERVFVLGSPNLFKNRRYIWKNNKLEYKLRRVKISQYQQPEQENLSIVVGKWKLLNWSRFQQYLGYPAPVAGIVIFLSAVIYISLCYFSKYNDGF